MLTAIIAALAGILGVALGGGVRAWEAGQARKHQGKALLFALAAEVEALTRLIEHRRFVDAMIDCAMHAEDMVAAGLGDEEAPFLTIFLKHNYFTAYEAATPNLGLLDPYMADRIVRFYTFVKATQENYDPGSPFQNGVTASAVVEIIKNDLMLLRSAIILGKHIADFRTIKTPKGFTDPFPLAIGQAEQPAPPTEAAA